MSQAYPIPQHNLCACHLIAAYAAVRHVPGVGLFNPKHHSTHFRDVSSVRSGRNPNECMERRVRPCCALLDSASPLLRSARPVAGLDPRRLLCPLGAWQVFAMNGAGQEGLLVLIAFEMAGRFHSPHNENVWKKGCF